VGSNSDGVHMVCRLSDTENGYLLQEVFFSKGTVLRSGLCDAFCLV
jgi:hypothetical protein